MKIKNDWAKATYILYLNHLAGVSMAKVLTHHEPSFYKFNTRLGEVEKAHPKLKVARTRIKYTSKMDGKRKSYIQYTPLSPLPYLLNLTKKLNEEGFKGKTHKPTE